MLALAAFVLVIAVLRRHGLRLDANALRFTLPPMLHSLPRILMTGLAINVVVTLLLRRSVREYLRHFFSLESLSTWVRLCFAFMLATFAYAWLKVCIPLLNQRLWDHEIWRLDRFAHFGIAPSVFIVELFGRGAALRLIDYWYGAWIFTVFIAWSWGTAMPDLARRRNFMFACLFISVAGVWIYLALPALGPCYAYPEIFAEVREDLVHAAPTQTALAANYSRMLEGRDGSLRQFNPYLGIAAFPSLHVGAHWLFALWARRHARRLFVPLALATLFTFIGSLATGWHYAVDGWAGMLLAWLSMRLADLCEPVEAADSAPSPVAVGRSGSVRGGAAS
ncbi:MAG: phosphatase PAP2 family protein [Rhodocyclaceae bacterium]|nr:phosphatase PAP2 family protein [Rhodocyclaceae bacterium]